ncbi:glutamine ABC transporter, substrate binding and permease protein [Agrilactobacillus composti DSM 18527 = JCM 14202]|uniref:Glutamine ABC transporter, substrate binding and permease protein n=1 Tax=Agrilactobacillus composti DSM 18527 = JCM 14202 TaxID=1423734 RepID=X0PSH7_9LACO|nr:ABC transporter substrate-binding protein/permease [Agrilactobacillus composti]KRM30932.1 glutamine ABC transporter, substrate binding and permease protein [Agrilactobacillus composti DSM 18527 = JCM 14202]GAF40877.1 amino acid ABC transporter, amino acid-binding/permease protein [Agrilactobacillus composti DSM 18527 = JCM 14202]
MPKTKQFIMLIVTVLLVTIGLNLTAANQVQAATTPDDTLAQIKKKGVLVMGTSPNYPPYEFQANVNGKQTIVGMDIEIGKQIAKDLGVKLEIKPLSFSSLLVSLETGKVDMILSGLSPTPERAKSVDFTNVYYTESQSIIINRNDAATLKNKASFAGKPVGAETGTLQYDLIKKQMPGAKLVGMGSAADLIMALKTHKVDGVVKGTASATAYATSDPSLATINGDFTTDQTQAGNAIAVAKGADSLKTALNQSITKIQKRHLIQRQYLKTAGKYLKSDDKSTSMVSYWQFFAKGIEYTLGMSIVGIVFGAILGILVAAMRISKTKLLKWIAIIYTEFLRDTPLMAQVLFIYFGLGALLNIPALLAGIIAISVNTSAYISEIVRGGVQGVSDGQYEAAKSLGIKNTDMYRFIIFPQALKSIWPSLGNQFITLIKDTSIVSIIGVTELIYQMGIVQAETYRGVAPIAVTILLYFIIIFTLSRILRHVEKRIH